MKTVLIIAPQFVPSSYPPAQRVRLFTNHLASFGWKPVVLTVRPEFLEETPDPEFAKLVRPDLEIVRTRALHTRLTRCFGLGDLGIRALYFQIKEAKKICRERKIDAVLIPGPPWYSFLAGPALRKHFGVPYVLDYIDPWVVPTGKRANVFTKAFWYRRLALWLEPAAVRGAARIVAVSEGTNHLLKTRYPFLNDAVFAAIPYGGEAADLEAAKKNPSPNRIFTPGDGLFHWVYVGAMLPKAYGTLGAILDAVKRLQIEQPELFQRMRFHFVGTTYAPNASRGLVTPLADARGLSGVVTEHPSRVPYAEANTLLTQADAVLAFGSDEPHYTASKIFPALVCGRPLLAVYHEKSSVLDILRKAGTGLAVSFSENRPLSGKLEEITDALRRFMSGAPVRVETEPGAFEEYSARSMTKKLAEVLSSL